MDNQNTSYNVVGLMSGTSLDGLDVSLTRYNIHINSGKPTWTFFVLKAQTFPYNNHTIDLLTKMKDSTITDYLKLNIQYSQKVAANIQQFLIGIAHKIDFISSHGHTILHQPHHGISLQCCDPVYLAASTGIDCIGNFRQLDVYRGGQGAPLVPYGAELFHEYNVFLNFGGIVNIDCNGAGWDIGYCNMLSNYYANLTGIEYDKEGSLGRCGKFNQSVNYIMSSDQKLSSITTNKSFGRQDFEEILKKIEVIGDISAQEVLYTHYQFLSNLIIAHISQLIRSKLKIEGNIKVLCTGGGVYNSFLMELLRANSANIEFVVPDKQTIQFKEAIIFGFLGIKFLREEKNCSRGIGGTLSKGKIIQI